MDGSPCPPYPTLALASSSRHANELNLLTQTRTESYTGGGCSENTALVNDRFPGAIPRQGGAQSCLWPTLCLSATRTLFFLLPGYLSPSLSRSQFARLMMSSSRRRCATQLRRMRISGNTPAEASGRHFFPS